MVGPTIIPTELEAVLSRRVPQVRLVNLGLGVLFSSGPAPSSELEGAPSFALFAKGGLLRPNAAAPLLFILYLLYLLQVLNLHLRSLISCSI
jgi:hypothetical protein